MRKPLLLAGSLCFLAAGCGTPTPTNVGHLTAAPPLPYVKAAANVVLDANGSPRLRVTAVVWNEMSSGFQVLNGPQCPLAVRLFPDPTGEYMGSSFSTGCPAGATTLDLAPGDTLTFVRTLPVDSLGVSAQGTYAINVEVVTASYVIGAWAGTVQLPLHQ